MRRLGENTWQVAEGVYGIRVPVPFPIAFVNVFLVRHGDKGLLIDGGIRTEACARVVAQAFRDMGFDVRSLEAIVVTHIHPDHYGMANRLRRESGAPLYMHPLEDMLVQSRYDTVEELLEHTRQWLCENGVPEADVEEIQKASLGVLEFVEPARPDAFLRGGETVSLAGAEFEVYWTPGHSPGHIVLFDRARGHLFAGDHILERITPNISCHPQSRPDPLGDYVASLEALRDLPVQLVLPGHGRPFTSFRERVEEILRHQRERSQAVLSALGGRTVTAYDVVPDIWTGRSLTAHDKRLAMGEVLAHLVYLERLGRVERRVDEGLVRWSRKALVQAS